jgi:hypothetical protein
MAIPIGTTPVLRGKEAEEFEKKALANQKRRASKKEVEKAAKAFISMIKKVDKNMFF